MKRKVLRKGERFAYYFLFRFAFHSALATLINNSSSRIGIQLVRTFITFSKSESIRISHVPSISAAEAACSTSRPPWNEEVRLGPKRSSGEVEDDGLGVDLTVGVGGGGSESPRSMKTSQMRS